MKRFKIPEIYQSTLIKSVHAFRDKTDPRKKDFRATELHFGTLSFIIARSFGFCYGVENAVERSYRAVTENPGKKIYLLSQMIHNPTVNEDLLERGIRFVMDTQGNQQIAWDTITGDDIVLIPAFGTTLEIEKILKEKGIVSKQYDTTCPFVQKVWNRSKSIGTEGYTIVVHGKPNHEETRATFSHSAENAPTVVVRDLDEAGELAAVITGERPVADFAQLFGAQASDGFDPREDLGSIGVVNQTTMLAGETKEIAALLREAMAKRYGRDELERHFADTRDTLCYATNENQSATIAMIEEASDLCIVVGGYNSSNTSHLVELAEQRMPTYFVKGAEEICSAAMIRHFDLADQTIRERANWIPPHRPLTIALTSGASCPDAIVDEVLSRTLSLFGIERPIEEVLREALSGLETA